MDHMRISGTESSSVKIASVAKCKHTRIGEEEPSGHVENVGLGVCPGMVLQVLRITGEDVGCRKYTTHKPRNQDGQNHLRNG